MRHLVVAVLLVCGGPVWAQFAIGTPYKVPSDASASYTNLEFGGAGKLRTIVTKREGKSGVSYSKREVDCDAGTVRYLGTGDSMEAMSKSKPDSKLAPIVDGSIASHVAAQACEPYLRTQRQKLIDADLKKAGIKR